MKAKLSILVVIALLTLHGTVTASDTKTGHIIVLVKQLRNNDGEVRVALYNSSQGFPDKRQLAYKVIPARIGEKEAKVIFEDIPYGIYAISILHDENRNGKMETTLLGIPKEGCGTSNNPKVKLGKPKYKECMVCLQDVELTIEIMTFY